MKKDVVLVLSDVILLVAISIFVLVTVYGEVSLLFLSGILFITFAITGFTILIIRDWVRGFKNKNLEIIIEDFTKEVSLEEIAQVAFEHNSKIISYVKTEKGEILFTLLIRSDSRILNEGTFLGTYLVRHFISAIYYTPVNGYKRFLFYDHARETTEYDDYHDDDDRHHYDTIYSISVLRYPHPITEVILPHIFKNMEGKNKSQ